jgi:hypothetical protein
LNLAGVSAVDDDVIRTVASMRSLERLDISECQGLSRKGFLPLGDLCNLKDLSVGWNSKLTDAAIECLPSSLEALDLSYASRISDAGLRHLKKMHNLKVLKLTNCLLVHDDG